jgi:hypothetical protein
MPELTTTTTTTTTTAAVDELVAGIEAGAVPAGVFSDDAVLDATVPNWRFSVRGGARVHAQLSEWFADPGRFEQLNRIRLPGGELVEFTLAWEERGVAHRCHQAHILRLEGGRVSSDIAFCGGRWPATLIAEMEPAEGREDG